MQLQDTDLTRLAQQLLHNATERATLRHHILDALLQAAERMNQIEQAASQSLAQMSQSNPAAAQLQQKLTELHQEFLSDLRTVAPGMNEQDLRIQLMRSIGLNDQEIALLMGNMESG
ncbi:MAG: hypothetical protein IT211_00300 [Armatimonadetes bacterium]|nr:hypothetical protein [Armatimonadota bacterium]